MDSNKIRTIPKFVPIQKCAVNDFLRQYDRQIDVCRHETHDSDRVLHFCLHYPWCQYQTISDIKDAVYRRINQCPKVNVIGEAILAKYQLPNMRSCIEQLNTDHTSPNELFLHYMAIELGIKIYVIYRGGSWCSHHSDTQEFTPEICDYVLVCLGPGIYYNTKKPAAARAPKPLAVKVKRRKQANPRRSSSYMYTDCKPYNVCKRPKKDGNKCSNCKLRFCSKESLRRHYNSAHATPRYFCAHCGKGFYYQAELDRHMLTHSTERKHKCTECNKAFKDKSELVKHNKREHSIEKPEYQCKECNKTFSEKKRLSQHAAVHRAPSLPCSVCARMFSFKPALHYHMDKAHPGLRVKT